MLNIDNRISPLKETWVAIDTETTGLSEDKDSIIEVGCVKFVGERHVETYKSLVNPLSILSDFTINFTGITQNDVNNAPVFEDIIEDMREFIGDAPVVGHNIQFDLGFLNKSGLKIDNPVADTWDMAYVLLPSITSYSLSNIAMDLGIAHDKAHRALEDAAVTAHVFNYLLKSADKLEDDILYELSRTATQGGSRLNYVLSGLIANRNRSEIKSQQVIGFDVEKIRSRLAKESSIKKVEQITPVDLKLIESALSAKGSLSHSMLRFEERPEQMTMAKTIAETINSGIGDNQTRLIVEAGTGVGKSLAYLLPSVIYALKNNKRIVVSTNTINLQEQLLTKDMPLVIEALKNVDSIDVEKLRFTQLKGRDNYLCLNKLLRMRLTDKPTWTEGRLISKVLVWVRDTVTGDKSELNLGSRGASAVWGRLSAQGSALCKGISGACFLRSARDKASSSHIVITNHSLLMADIASDGSILPDYDILIIDEAHHLEDSATRQLGFELNGNSINDRLTQIMAETGALNTGLKLFKENKLSLSRIQSLGKILTDISEFIPKTREYTASLLSSIEKVGSEAQNSTSYNTNIIPDIRITSGIRSQPAWSEIEIDWQKIDLALIKVDELLNHALIALEGTNHEACDRVLDEVIELIQSNQQLRGHLEEFVIHPSKDGVYWVSNASSNRSFKDRNISIQSAPLYVGDVLSESVYSKTSTVIMTSATLATGNNFEYVIERTGFQDSTELLLGSPFDYATNSVLCVPDDMPEPNLPNYQDAINNAITNSVVASQGKAMALFTSYSSLNKTYKDIKETLKSHDIQVLAQGIDGNPNKIVSLFQNNQRSLLLGTPSFWEGVDLPGESLQLLLLTRLPFNVPTDPIFAARSDWFQEPFKEYAVPQAVIRLRQGFGRLIRTETDRGVAAVLDKRILSKGYGKVFLESMPPAHVVKTTTLEMPKLIEQFLS